MFRIVCDPSSGSVFYLVLIDLQLFRVRFLSVVTVHFYNLEYHSSKYYFVSWSSL